MLGNRVNDLEARLAHPGQAAWPSATSRTTSCARPTTPPSAPSRNCATKSPPSTAANRRRWKSCKTEKAAVEEQLRVARDERAKLQRDINAIQQQAESSWATERMENALLRERINDIAAEVAKLAMQLEGPNSPIEAMLAAEPAVPAKPPKPANDLANGAAATGGRARGRHARRAHPGAAVARLPRPPAGGVSRMYPEAAPYSDSGVQRFSDRYAPDTLPAGHDPRLTPIARAS